MKVMLLAASLAVSAGQLEAEPVCKCVAPGEPGFEAGTVRRGGQELTLAEIASLLAPILWFSSDEPLLIEGQGRRQACELSGSQRRRHLHSRLRRQPSHQRRLGRARRHGLRRARDQRLQRLHGQTERFRFSCRAPREHARLPQRAQLVVRPQQRIPRPLRAATGQQDLRVRRDGLVELEETGDKYFTNPEWKFVSEFGASFAPEFRVSGAY